MGTGGATFCSPPISGLDSAAFAGDRPGSRQSTGWGPGGGIPEGGGVVRRGGEGGTKDGEGER